MNTGLLRPTAYCLGPIASLKGIPPETYEYRLGNRSALEWIVDQYQISTDKRSNITNDLNREDDPEYILHLMGQPVRVSMDGEDREGSAGIGN